MKNDIFKKNIVVMVIVLFIVLSFNPIIQGLVNKKIINDLNIQIKSEDDSLFDLKIRLLMILGHMPSLSACIIKNNIIKWSKGYLYANREHQICATNKTIYMIASISKTFAATAILQLNETGLLDIDEDVNNYLDFELRNPRYTKKNITCRMLLAHRSSLADFTPILAIYFTFLGYPNEMLKEFLVPSGYFYKSCIWNDYPPGEGFTYSNIGLEIIEYIVERVTEQSYDEYCTENILQRLNMSNTSYQLKDLNLKRIARPYIWLAGIYFPLPQVQMKNYAAGGLRTTVLDLSQFLLAHMNNGTYSGITILNKTSTETMHTPQLGNNNYGLGWIIRNENGNIIEGHSGGIFGGRAGMWYRRSDKTGIIYFWNQYEMMIPVRNRPIENEAQKKIVSMLWEKADNF